MARLPRLQPLVYPPLSGGAFFGGLFVLVAGSYVVWHSGVLVLVGGITPWAEPGAPAWYVTVFAVAGLVAVGFAAVTIAMQLRWIAQIYGRPRGRSLHFGSLFDFALQRQLTAAPGIVVQVRVVRREYSDQMGRRVPHSRLVLESGGRRRTKRWYRSDDDSALLPLVDALAERHIDVRMKRRDLTAPSVFSTGGDVVLEPGGEVVLNLDPLVDSWSVAWLLTGGGETDVDRGDDWVGVEELEAQPPAVRELRGVRRVIVNDAAPTVDGAILARRLDPGGYVDGVALLDELLEVCASVSYWSGFNAIDVHVVLGGDVWFHLRDTRAR